MVYRYPFCVLLHTNACIVNPSWQADHLSQAVLFPC